MEREIERERERERKRKRERDFLNLKFYQLPYLPLPHTKIMFNIQKKISHLPFIIFQISNFKI